MFWALILAGGEGKRLARYTRHLTGRAIPKQFCQVVGTSSLLEQTLRRISLTVERRHTLIALTQTHQTWYLPLLNNFATDQLVIQPSNRDTAPAILYSLLRIARQDPLATVALFPSDHYVSDDHVFMDHVKLASEAIHLRQHPIAVLGIPATARETGYGWIEPANPIESIGTVIYSVRRFWEKPSAELAEDLLRRGCLWNSFVMVARVSSLIQLFEAELPDLYKRFISLTRVFGTDYEYRSVDWLYTHLGPINFSEQVLVNAADRLSVIPVRGVEWSDLGSARRVLDTLARIQRPKRGLR
jgi:mannose-1-phosphate guanylyltransferase